MAYSIEYEAAAWRQFKKLDKATQLRLTPKIDALATNYNILPGVQSEALHHNILPGVQSEALHQFTRYSLCKQHY